MDSTTPSSTCIHVLLKTYAQAKQNIKIWYLSLKTNRRYSIVFFRGEYEQVSFMEVMEVNHAKGMYGEYRISS